MNSNFLQWMEVLDTMLKEAEWARGTYVPKMDEYIENGYVSFALGPIVLPTIYLVGPQLSESVVGSDELRNLFKLMSMCGRLLNDIQSYKVQHCTGEVMSEHSVVHISMSLSMY